MTRTSCWFPTPTTLRSLAAAYGLPAIWRNVEKTFSFKDDGIGVKLVEVSKDDIILSSYDSDNGEYKTTENGIYKITAVDYLDNKYEETVEINDIFNQVLS